MITGSGNNVAINTVNAASSASIIKNIHNEGVSSDFEKEIFTSLFANNSSPVTLSFKSDSLCLARLVNRLKQGGNFGNEYIVFVDGYDNELCSEVRAFGTYTSGILDGYVRNIEIEIQENCIVDIGGSNATLERIAASNVDVVMSREVYDNILTPYLPFYRTDEICHLDSKTLIEQFRYEQIESVIAIARRLADEPSLKMLLNYLNRNFEPQVMEFITEGFRSFEYLCLKNSNLSRQATTSLILFIKNNIKNNELSLSVIYAIESLGYVSIHHSETKEIACLFLSGLIQSDANLYVHRDILWAALVSIDRTLVNSVDIDMVRRIAEASSSNNSILKVIAENIHKKKVT
ncbi:MAG: hypothetical protein D3911_07190 [Candidatus Electrothrix sp. AW3_4]|nr:hypothetical protein [Candidatus Electrothrix gigas]